MIPKADLTRVQQWIQTQNEDLPEPVRELVRYELDVTVRTVTVFECRPPWQPDVAGEWTRNPVARLGYTSSSREWSLYWADRNSEFHEYDLLRPTRHVERLIVEIERDPQSIFWG